MATLIIAVIIFAAVGFVVYNRFFRKRNGEGCKSCGDSGCPLYDQAQALQQNNKKHA
ncbi:MAG: FeoB-associated Cys-rich membrane protein [Lactobacillus sp.]|jgi:Trk-type K+ transport system membrane component|nr:FeoB-associated Cys-rich membrane protein [Lactobacillus sp.]MCI2033493.1 FeoB-associated Cys-rich membrane protein [Lactobacillus sp.]